MTTVKQYGASPDGPPLRAAEGPSDIAFLGTDGRRAGHYFWRPGCGGAVTDSSHGWSWGPFERVDGAFVQYGEPYRAVLVHDKGCTVVAWVDFAGDRRPGSNANLLATGTWTVEEMLTAACSAFPWAVERFNKVAAG